MKIWLYILLFGILFQPKSAQDSLIGAYSDPEKIVKKSQDKLLGKSSVATITMSIVRPTWRRDLTMKAWSEGQDFSLILVTAPAREKGVAFLKREKEIWNWQPSIDRVIKLPPSMMSQSWMGSDFTNDDLVEQSSMVEDFTHTYLGREDIVELPCHKIELIAKEEAAVVWDKIIMWIDEDEFMQLKAEFYDDEGYLVSTMFGKSPKIFDDKLLPSVLEVIPEEDPGNKTIITYESMEFDIPIKRGSLQFRI